MPREVTIVVVIGALARQERLIEKKCCRSNLCLKFVSRNRTPANLPQANHVILWVRFLNHKCSDSIYRRVHRDRIHLHSGGLSQLQQLIDRITLIQPPLA
jgi:hypothetical protein